MSMFYCNHCDSLSDADDGCDVDPSNELELICVDCMEAAEAEEAETAHGGANADTTEQSVPAREGK